MKESDKHQEPSKDEDTAHPIASDWKPTLRKIVESLAQGDYRLTGVESVTPVPETVVEQIRRHILDYGETLTELPDEAWKTSVSQWMGTHWDVLVDLWTVESGASDMVLNARVFESNTAFRFEVISVHVP